MRGNTVNNMKLMIIAKIMETRTRFLQTTCSECIYEPHIKITLEYVVVASYASLLDRG